MIDIQARERIQANQQTDRLIEAIKESIPLPPTPMDTAPFKDVVKSNNNQTLLSKISLNIFQKIQNSLLEIFNKITSKEELKADLAEINQSIKEVKIPELPEIVNIQSQELLQAVKDIKIPTIPKFPDFPKIEIPRPLPFPKSFSVDSLPPVFISNLQDLSTLISDLQVTTIQAIQSLKIGTSKSTNPTPIDFKPVLDALQEIRASFDAFSGTKIDFPKSIDVNNFPVQFVPPTPTHISLNAVNGFFKTTPATVSTSLTILPTYGVLANRRSMLIYNNSTTVTIFIGGSDVTANNGLPVPPSSYGPPLDNGTRTILYGITSGGSADVRVMEISDINSGV
jgi:hypothetical protein